MWYSTADVREKISSAHLVNNLTYNNKTQLISKLGLNALVI